MAFVEQEIKNTFFPHNGKKLKGHFVRTVNFTNPTNVQKSDMRLIMENCPPRFSNRQSYYYNI